MNYTGEPNKDIIIFTTKMGAESGFFFKLLTEENDWSFIIKINAFLEAAISELVINVINRPELSDIFYRLELADSRYGKIVWLKSLNLLGDDELKCIRKLAELRNSYVHDISHIHLTLNQYIKDRDPNQLQQFINIFGYDANDPLEIAGHKIPKAEFIKHNPKLAIWFAVYSILLQIILTYQEHDLVKKELETIKIKATVLDKILIKTQQLDVKES